MTVDRSDACLGGLLNLNVLVQLVHFVHKRHAQNIRHLTLVGLSSLLLERTFTRQRLLRATLVTRFQIERVFLDIFDDIFLLDSSLKSTKCTFDRLSIIDPDFGQPFSTSSRHAPYSTKFTGAEYARLPQVDDEKNGLIFISNY